MANPRRSSLHHLNPIIPLSEQNQQTQQPSSLSLSFSSLLVFLKRPHAFPFLLFIFILLTWLSLRFQHSSTYHQSPFSSQSQKQKWVDADANLVRFSAAESPSQISRDGRGWLLSPVTAAQEAGIYGGAQSCSSVHVGEIRPGGVRGNHRHHMCNETFVIWGAMTKFRLENSHVEDKGYAEVTIGVEEVAIAASPSGTAHALINVDRERTTFFLGCQDSMISYNSSDTDFNVWKDL